jgi:hypothetical protein
MLLDVMCGIFAAELLEQCALASMFKSVAHDGDVLVAAGLAVITAMLYPAFGIARTCEGLRNWAYEGTAQPWSSSTKSCTSWSCCAGTDCRGARFEDIARRFFLHEAHTHELITRRERAAEGGIRRGTRVTFPFAGRRLTGVVNRVTKRVTVLVEDPDGVPYSDGRRYKTYYVPIAHLQMAD